MLPVSGERHTRRRTGQGCRESGGIGAGFETAVVTPELRFSRTLAGLAESTVLGYVTEYIFVPSSRLLW